jgi:hypothetical protein
MQRGGFGGCDYHVQNPFLRNASKKGSHARFVVDILGSRAAIDASIQLTKLRAVGVHVGHLTAPEAEFYVTERMPNSLKDGKRRDEIGRFVVEIFDGCVLTLKRVCKAIQKGPPGDVAFVEATIERSQREEEKQALLGWINFTSYLSDKLGTDFEARSLEEAVMLLLMDGSAAVETVDIIEIMSRKSANVPLNSRDLGLFNADAGYHPFAIDPFQTKISLNGKSIGSVLRQRYKC